VVEDEYHFIVECERGRLAREVLLVEVGEKVAETLAQQLRAPASEPTLVP
jgi:hypothetical protein